MAKTTYDPAVIEQFADSLYSQAKTVVTTYSALGALFGFIVGFGLASAQNTGGSGVMVGGVVALFGLLLGLALGRSKAFALKLQAQAALCQVQIERNTARASGARAA